MRKWFRGLFAAPMLRRIGWHLRRIHTNLDKRFYRSLVLGLTVVLALAALTVTVFEEDIGFRFLRPVVLLGADHGDRCRRFGLRGLSGRLGGQLAAQSLRCRHRRGDDRRVGRFCH